MRQRMVALTFIALMLMGIVAPAAAQTETVDNTPCNTRRWPPTPPARF